MKLSDINKAGTIKPYINVDKFKGNLKNVELVEVLKLKKRANYLLCVE